jgi:16S rRNA C1402 (ribose-2'-O) methylase RsmI
MTTGVVDVIKQLNLLRSEVDKTSPLLLQSFDFWTQYTKIHLMNLKACMKVLINKVFHQMLKLYCFKFLLVQRSARFFG